MKLKGREHAGPITRWDGFGSGQPTGSLQLPP